MSGQSVSSSAAIIKGISWDTVVEEIKNSNRMKYKWAQKENEIAHTSIVIQLNKTPRYILDFGGMLAGARQKAKAGSLYVSDKMSRVSQPGVSSQKVREVAGNMRISGVINLGRYHGENLQIKDTLATIDLTSRDAKDNAASIFLTLKYIEIGDYVLASNNCRTYVIMVATELLRQGLMDQSAWNRFAYDISEVLGEDERKYLEFIRSTKSIKDYNLKDEV